MDIEKLKNVEPLGNYITGEQICIKNGSINMCTDEEEAANKLYIDFIDGCIKMNLKDSKKKCEISDDNVSRNIQYFLSKFRFKPNVNYIDFGAGFIDANKSTGFSDFVKQNFKSILDKYGITNYKDSKAKQTKKDTQNKSTKKEQKTKSYGYKIGCHAPGIRSIMHMTDKRVSKMLRSNKFKI